MNNTIPDLSQLPSWEGIPRVGIDTETRDPHIRTLGPGVGRPDSYIVGVSLCLEGRPPIYLPIRHEGGGNLPIETVAQYLRDQFQGFTGEIVGMNLSYDLSWLDHDLGVTWPSVKAFRDIAIADPLIYELHASYSMDAIAKRHGCRMKDESVLTAKAEALGLHPKKDLWKLPAQDVALYAATDAEIPLEILRKQEKLIEAFNLTKIWELETQVLPVLLKMQKRGVLIDQDQLARVEQWSIEEETKALALVHRETGIQIGLGEVWKASALSPVFTAIGITLPRTPTGKPSVKKGDVLNYNHPVATAVNRAREVNKLRTTFVKSVRNHMVNGRIHCRYNQIAREDDYGDQAGARYGRLSCSNPNLQQQPSRGEFAGLWRGIYIPEPGAFWACNDFSQQEPRWTTHFASIMKLPKAEEAAHEYRTNPKVDNHDMMAKLTGLDRKPAKAIFLGLCYGEGGAKLCHTMGLPTRWALSLGDYSDRETLYFETEAEAREAARNQPKGRKKFLYEAAGEEGQRILNQFNEKAPYIKQLSKKAQARAEDVGFIRTVGGRRLNFEEKADMSGYTFTYRALNRLIQGSSADQMKRAMVEIDRSMPDTFLQLQVHDETDSSVADCREARMIAEIMRESTQASVPFRVDIEMGMNWGNLVAIPN